MIDVYLDRFYYNMWFEYYEHENTIRFTGEKESDEQLLKFVEI